MEDAKYSLIFTICKTLETAFENSACVLSLTIPHFSCEELLSTCGWELWFLPKISKCMWGITLSDYLSSKWLILSPFQIYSVKRSFQECHFTHWITVSTWFFFLEILLTIYPSNHLAQDVLVLFWSKLLVTQSTLGGQAMVNWWSS